MERHTSVTRRWWRTAAQVHANTMAPASMDTAKHVCKEKCRRGDSDCKGLSLERLPSACVAHTLNCNSSALRPSLSSGRDKCDHDEDLVAVEDNFVFAKVLQIGRKCHKTKQLPNRPLQSLRPQHSRWPKGRLLEQEVQTFCNSAWDVAAMLFGRKA